MSDEHLAELPHEPAPPEPRRLMPEPEMLIRGIALAGGGFALGYAALAGLQKSWMFAPLAAVLGGSGVLALWAALIHLSGGEKFDDHPFV